MRIITYIIFIIILLAGIIFAYLNASSVAFNYYFGIKTMPLSLLLIVAFGIGILVSFLFVVISWLRLKSKIFRQKKHIRNLEQEIAALKSAQNKSV